MTNNAAAFERIGVIGAGAWGTALAILCAGSGRHVMIWARRSEVAEAINATHRNEARLPGVDLPTNISATDQLDDLAGCDGVLYVSPTQVARSLFTDLFATGFSGALAICAKGVERGTGLLLPDVLKDVRADADTAILSGPSFAADVARGRPTAITLACARDASAASWIASLSAPHFRLYQSADLCGVALGGAVKNVLAIAAGAVEGAGLGESARAAVIARGFVEFQRLGLALGAQVETMAGLSGLGDLILTATSATSRNMSLGLELGLGKAPGEALVARSSISEGAATAEAILTLAARYGVDMPICVAVADLISGARRLDEITTALLSRPLRAEGV